MEDNVDLFLYLTNIDNYIIDYMNILNLKQIKDINNRLMIDYYYMNFFKKFIKDCNKEDTCIVTKREVPYKELLEIEICHQVNDEYITNTSISYLYLYYIIKKWDNLPSNIFFYNYSNENTFPIDMYIVPKKNINYFSNNYKTFNLIYDDIILSKEESKKIKQPTNLKFIEWWKLYIQKNIPTIFEYCPELVFSVKRDNIKKNGLQYYLNIFNSINEKPYCKELFYLDRSWYYIFS